MQRLIELNKIVEFLVSNVSFQFPKLGSTDTDADSDTDSDTDTGYFALIKNKDMNPARLQKNL